MIKDANKQETLSPEVYDKLLARGEAFISLCYVSAGVCGSPFLPVTEKKD